MKVFIKYSLQAVLALFLSINLAAESLGQNIPVNLGVTFRNARLASLWIADAEGFFKKEGVEVKVINISGGTQGAQMMVSGGVDVSFDDPISCITATAAGVPVVDIFAGTPTLPFLIVGAPGIKSISELKGKRVGSSGLGPSASRLALLVGFKRLGLDPDKDHVTIVAAGQEPERIAGLSTGAIAATVISPEYRTRLDQLGVPLLADLRTLNIPWETASVITTAKNMQSKREMIERVIRALLQANAYILNQAHRARLVNLLISQLALKSAQDADAVYDDLIKFYVHKKPYPSREGILNIISEVGKSVPKAASLKFEDVTDASIIGKLDKSGFIDGLYK